MKFIKKHKYKLIVLILVLAAIAGTIIYLNKKAKDKTVETKTAATKETTPEPPVEPLVMDTSPEPEPLPISEEPFIPKTKTHEKDL